MWTVYFNIGAERASQLIAKSEDPGALARSGYTYLHILIVAGIIVIAVADELVLHHPGGHDGHTGLATAMAVVRRSGAVSGRQRAVQVAIRALPPAVSSRWGSGSLGLLAPAAMISTPLVLSASTTAVLIMVAVWEWLSLRSQVIATTHS